MTYHDVLTPSLVWDVHGLNQHPEVRPGVPGYLSQLMRGVLLTLNPAGQNGLDFAHLPQELFPGYAFNDYATLHDHRPP